MANSIRRIFGPRSREVRFTQSSTQTTPDNQDRAESPTERYAQSSTQTTPDDQDPPAYATAVEVGDSGCATVTDAGDGKQPPPPDNMTADNKNPPELSENQGRCDCSQHDGCCLEHHSLRHPSASTLAPVHSLMAYHLSFKHLSCMRRKLGDEMQKTRYIPELSWNYEVNSTLGVDYEMLSEVYTCKGEFLQRQQIRLRYGRGDSSPDGEQFFGCPHQSVRVSSPVRNERSSLVDVQVDISHHPPRCASHKSQRWCNLEGQYAHIAVCTICHSDAELQLRMSSHYLIMTYTCYRNLGTAEDSSDPKWTALLTGEGHRSRPDKELDLYKHVYKVAFRLCRSLLEPARYQTPSGMVDMSIRDDY
ncbi:unnamed protein product [Clonostachys rhizophaga]|uniref:Uncharacterized protein n=1 Tax=Clonostachys rhizophaga TaxID=160324 RepID=A0A9N9V2G6_9HYPO|nr:unnamed protein product [Clonostachys rhizophaga]